MRHKIALARCCRSTDIYWTLAVVHTKYFLEQGFYVDATDGSEEMCYIASNYTGIQVRRMLFEELDENKKYDGIWVCSSILHLPKNELKVVFMKMFKALKDDGIIYASFKYGDFHGKDI